MSFRKNLYILLSAVLISVMPSCDTGTKTSNDELLRKAKKAGKTAHWDQALTLTMKAVKNNPDDANALIMLALAQENLDKPEIAIEEIRKAADKAPESFMAQYNLGRMLFKQAKYYKCIAPLKEANKIRPDDINTLVLLAQTSLLIQNLEEAKDYYIKLSHTDQFRYQAYNELGIICTRQGKKKDALRYFLNAKQIAPDNPTIIFNIARFCDTEANNPSAARKYYIKYLINTQQNKELEVKRTKVAERAKALKN